MSVRVYLDYNASAPVWPEAADAADDALRAGANASSIHAPGRAARARIEDAREAVARLVGADPAGVVFTGGGTEANNQAIRCSGAERVLVSAIEHESVLSADEEAEILPVIPRGAVDPEALDRALAADARPALVAVMLANNETGVIQPVAQVAEIARRHGARVHCDAVQAAGKIAVDAAALGADSYALSAHKVGGPQGVGALVLRDPDSAGRLIHGGGQERGRRAGTENVAGIAGFGRAAEIVAARLEDFAGLAALRGRMEEEIRAIDPGAWIVGADAPRLPNTSMIVMPGCESAAQVIAMDLDGIAVSAGSACSSGRVQLPYVLDAMGVDEAAAMCALRVSPGWRTTSEEIDQFVASWAGLRRRTARRVA